MDSAIESEHPQGVPVEPPWGSLGRDFTLGVVSLGSKLILRWLNTYNTTNLATLEEIVRHRPDGTGLLTVCNHTSTLDDPVVMSNLMPWHFFASESHHMGNRWSLCAREICYKSKLLGQFFLSGKTLPIERGQGLGQPAMQTAAQLLARGDWVHLFPEGRVSFSGRLQACRWGVGKLICDAVTQSGRDPVIVPFYHSGMARIMPEHGRIPRVGQTVAVTVGEPIDVSDLTCQCHEAGNTQVWKELTERICSKLHALEEAAPPNPDQQSERQLSPGHADAHIEKQDPVLPEH
ncbi:hypothetical protein CVIRNUC_001135 [Coccomyxa viridis]|uniref:Tafazzin family protein n=1 Tax=Coccomyxa viridis TaxID=1274662 RepID=A0AAV1HSU2_9CHLO|nr:hypothetical protein CVIRNUC_001135 [Coccomyxa viridis]